MLRKRANQILRSVQPAPQDRLRIRVELPNALRSPGADALEAKTELQVGGSAKRAGDKVTVSVDLDGVKDPGEKVKLRVLLVEEKVKYVGGNGMRFHHMVVRALAGGPDVFGALASHAGDALFEACYQTEFPVTARLLRDKFESS